MRQLRGQPGQSAPHEVNAPRLASSSRNQQPSQSSPEERLAEAKELVRQAVRADAGQRRRCDIALAHDATVAPTDDAAWEAENTDPQRWDINTQVRENTPESFTAAQRETAVARLLSSIDLLSAFDRIKLIPRRDAGAALFYLQRDYKARMQLKVTGVNFYTHINRTFPSAWSTKRTKECLAWYKLCKEQPRLVFMPVQTWSTVQRLMAKKVLWNAVQDVKHEANAGSSADKENDAEEEEEDGNDEKENGDGNSDEEDEEEARVDEDASMEDAQDS